MHLKFARADLDDGDADIVVEMGNDGVGHGALPLCLLFRADHSFIAAAAKAEP